MALTWLEKLALIEALKEGVKSKVVDGGKVNGEGTNEKTKEENVSVIHHEIDPLKFYYYYTEIKKAK